MTKALLQQALDALVYHTVQTHPNEYIQAAIKALSEELAEPTTTIITWDADGCRTVNGVRDDLVPAVDTEIERLHVLLVKARDEFKELHRSHGYEFAHLPEIEAALDRHLTQK